MTEHEPYHTALEMFRKSSPANLKTYCEAAGDLPVQDAVRLLFYIVTHLSTCVRVHLIQTDDSDDIFKGPVN